MERAKAPYDAKDFDSERDRSEHSVSLPRASTIWAASHSVTCEEGIISLLRRWIDRDGSDGFKEPHEPKTPGSCELCKALNWT
jgi:hypothetical protein